MNTSAGSLHTILVPLDGSALAERALPFADQLARAMEAAILLLRVIPTTTWALMSQDVAASDDAYQTLIDAEDQEAHTYLERRADELRARGRRVHSFAVRGDPAATILGIEPRTHVDLVVMATHGRTGHARFALGSVADAVTRGGTVPGGRAPVLLVRPFGDTHGGMLERAVVPLDGSPLAELALHLAQQLGGSMLRRVTLCRVVDPDCPTDLAEEATRYLETARGCLSTNLGGRACDVESVILTGSPAEEIAGYAERHGDLLIMATHGRTGQQRWDVGSVADRVIQGTSVPLILVRAPHIAEQSTHMGARPSLVRELPPVLVVDEDPAFRRSVALALSENGHTVTEAATVDEATSLLRRGVRRMVVLLDRHRLGVLTAAANDRRLAGRHAYVLICADGDTLDACQFPAFNALTLLVLRKPFDASKLIETVAAAAKSLDGAALSGQR